MANVLHQALLRLKTSTVTPIKQDTIHSVGMYCGVRKIGDEIIDWRLSTREWFNFIRALCQPAPIAKCFLRQKPLLINAAKIIEHSPKYKGLAGQILAKNSDGFIVKTQDSVLQITEYFYDGKIKIGERLQ